MAAPTYWSAPDGVSPAGGEAIDLARNAGLELDDWQTFVLDRALREDSGGKWSTLTVGLCVPRQNGKGAILEARELAGLFLLGERLIIHSAHEFPTSLEAFSRLLALIEDTPELDAKVKRVSRSHGEEGIELRNRARIRFRTRTKGGGRGFSGDCVILDEAMILPEASIKALLPTLSARPNPQVWFVGSAVDQTPGSGHDGVAFSRVRGRGWKGDPGVAWFEWSADSTGVAKPEAVEFDWDAVAAANPAFGVRLQRDVLKEEMSNMSPRGVAVERLGVGDWPDPDGEATAGVIDMDAWFALFDGEDVPVGASRRIAFDVSPDRSWGAIGEAYVRDDGRVHVSVLDHRPGTGWIADCVERLASALSPVAVLCDARGPAASLVQKLEASGVPVEVTDVQEMTRSCGTIYDLISEDGLRHSGDDALDVAVKGAGQRTVGDAWAWSRRSSSVDITPLVAVTLAAGRVAVAWSSDPMVAFA